MLSTPLRFLHIPLTELCLATVLKSGQSFRWQRFDAILVTGPDSASTFPSPFHSSSSLHAIEPTLGEEVTTNQGHVEWAFGWSDRTVCLRQDDQGIYYRALYPYHHRNALLVDLETNSTLALLRHYFNLDTPLAALYADWSARDPHFKKKIEKDSERLKGIRVLNQDPWENLISFICSANNNISRITLMVNRVCEALGKRLPHPILFDPSTVCETVASVPANPPTSASSSSGEPSMYAFPSPTSLSLPNTDALLRHLGFGYRAPYIAWSSQHLLDHSASLQLTPDDYLASLKQVNFEDKGGIEAARQELLRFKGVGRKVADCVLLFSLGWIQTVPVDTHVFQIAIRDYAFPCSKATALTPLLHDRVADKLGLLWGPYSGWAQQVLFFADLKPSSPDGGVTKAVKGVMDLGKFDEDALVDLRKERKSTWQEEVDELMRTPGAKRRRVQVSAQTITTTKVEVGVEGVDVKVKVEDAYPSPALSTYTSSPSSGRGGGAKKKGRDGRSLKDEEGMELVLSRKSPIKS
ncbi:BQ2448_2534 [Microbotryum intermedium]|uniref:DNA-(apurinic or apyrimidinic site) lyase n=1 Tax=Microbotryum intermedium TaxID=269621 RepID=A0A238FCB2_9BASI|nr:BQ2448_2534 [Microbotryum intermedium]